VGINEGILEQQRSCSTSRTPRAAANFASAAATRLNALIVGRGDLETVLAGENLANPILAGDVVDVGYILATLAAGVTSERRSDSTTTTHIGAASDINTLITASVVGDTTEGLSSRASRVVAFALGRVLRLVGRVLCLWRVLRLGGVLGVTSLCERATHPVTLNVGWAAYAIGGSRRRRRRETIPARKVAREIDAAGGAGVGRVAARLLIRLALDEFGEIILGAVLTSSINELLGHIVATEESGDGGFTEAGVEVTWSDGLTARSKLNVHIQSGANVGGAPPRVSPPRLDHILARGSIGNGGREEEREQCCQHGELHGERM